MVIAGGEGDILEFSGSPISDLCEKEKIVLDANHEENAQEIGKSGADKVYLAISDYESRLSVGQVVSSIDEAYALYMNYALLKGFVVRKSKNCYFEQTKEIRLKIFLCNKEGEKLEKDIGTSRRYTRNDIKTGCKAKLEIFRERHSETWKVKEFVAEHNHELALTDETHLLKSASKINCGVAGLLGNMVNSGTRLNTALNFLEHECGGEEHLGFTRKDAYNLINALKRSKIPGGDCQELFRHFQNRANENNYFFWDAEFDEFGLVRHFFWRDSRCAIDYEYFGDVVSFDTTNRTNRYSLICAPFVGINHHGHNMMFGCAFLSDEKTKTFEWLFRTFLRGMENKHPQTIITDQCQAMMNAIGIVFPNTRHRLCQWHIKKKTLGKFNGNKDLNRMFMKCMSDCETEEEFEKTWSEMIITHGCHNHDWLKRMYKLRDKWSSAFNGTEFNGGLKSTSRSESSNHVLNDIGGKTTSLYNFVIAFDDLVRRWRANEKNDDFNCKQGKPTLAVKHSALLIHAASVYTNVVYKIFEHELKNGTMANSVIAKYSNGGMLFVYHVICEKTRRVRIVLFDMTSSTVECTCRKFESVGILCAHALLVLKSESIVRIPDRYINRRWTKDVKNRVKKVVYGETENENHLSDSEMVFSNQIMRFTSELVLRSKPHMRTREILKRYVEQAASEIDDYLDKLSLEDNSLSFSEVGEGAIDLNNETVILDPPIKSKKLSNVRLRSFWERDNKKRRSIVETSMRSKSQTESIIVRQQGNFFDNGSTMSQPLHQEGGINLGWNVYSSNLPEPSSNDALPRFSCRSSRFARYI